MSLRRMTGEKEKSAQVDAEEKTTQKILAILREYPSASRQEIAQVLPDITENGGIFGSWENTRK